MIAQERTENEARYQDKHNRKLRSDAVRVESALLILSEEQVARCNPDEIWQKCIEFKEWFELEFHTKIRAMDWHRDEGAVDEKGELISRNNHVHIEYDNVDKEGEMVRRKFSKGALYKLQDKTAEIFKPLGFERGNDSRKDPNYTVKRGLSIKEYRAKMKREKDAKMKKENEAKQKFNRQILAKAKDVNQTNRELKQEQKRIREAMKQVEAERQDYAMLEQKNSDIRREMQELKNKVKDEELTIKELETHLDKFKVEYEDLKIELAQSIAINRQIKEQLLILQQKPKQEDKISAEDVIKDINRNTNTKYLLDRLEALNYINMSDFGCDGKGTELKILEDGKYNDIEVWELLKDVLEIEDDLALDIAINCQRDSVRDNLSKKIKLSM